MHDGIIHAKGYTRDTNTNAVLSVDNESLQTYRKEREKIIAQKALEQEVSNLKSDIKDIKEMLMVLANRTN